MHGTYGAGNIRANVAGSMMKHMSATVVCLIVHGQVYEYQPSQHPFHRTSPLSPLPSHPHPPTHPPFLPCTLNPPPHPTHTHRWNSFQEGQTSQSPMTMPLPTYTDWLITNSTTRVGLLLLRFYVACRCWLIPHGCGCLMKRSCRCSYLGPRCVCGCVFYCGVFFIVLWVYMLWVYMLWVYMLWVYM